MMNYLNQKDLQKKKKKIILKRKLKTSKKENRFEEYLKNLKKEKEYIKEKKRNLNKKRQKHIEYKKKITFYDKDLYNNFPGPGRYCIRYLKKKSFPNY